MARSLGLVNASLRPKRERRSYFTPEGKVALMFLKMKTQMSFPKLMEALNGNIFYQMFCDIVIDPARPLTAIVWFSLREKACLRVLPFHLPHLFQYLSQQVKQSARYLPGLALRVLPLFALRQVRLLHIKELRPGAMDIQFAACLAHQLISLLNTFPQQFLVCRG